MLGHYILDSRGNPVPAADLHSWVSWFETAKRTVALTHLGSAYVSTAFLGIDMRFDRGPPLLFESMIFGAREFCDRCSTREEAFVMHERMCWLLRDLLTHEVPTPDSDA